MSIKKEEEKLAQDMWDTLNTISDEEFEAMFKPRLDAIYKKKIKQEVWTSEDILRNEG